MEDDEYDEDLSLNNPAMTQTEIYRIETGLYSTRSRRSGVPTNRRQNIAEPTSRAKSEEDNASSKPIEALNSASTHLKKYNVGWRRVVCNLSPSWFAVCMGTGVVGLLVFALPFQARWLYYLSIVFFALNAALFLTFFVLSLLRYTLFPEIWGVMIKDPTNSLFLGTIPIAFATLIEQWVYICVPVWGYWAVTLAWICWMIDIVVAAAVTVFLAFSLMSEDHHSSLERITAAQLLPIAATIVASGTGSEVSAVLTNPEHALGTLITCYVAWGMGVPLAMAVLVMYYQRLAVHKLPSREVIVSCFLPLGPLGFGGYSIMYMGKVARNVFPATGTIDPMAGSIAYVFGFFLALIMWGFGLVWLILALASIYKSRPFPFNMGWWGFVFPCGVMTASTVQLGNELPSITFKVFGTIGTVVVALLWMIVAAGTVKGALSGRLFNAPCLKNIPPPNPSDLQRVNPAKRTKC